MIKFFKNYLHFKQAEIIIFTEDEVRSLIELLDQSKIFKQYNEKLAPRLEAFARSIFVNQTSNASQLLTVFINESKNESIKDFVVNRNPELALNIEPGPDPVEANEAMQLYLRNMKEKCRPLSQVKFENFHYFFKNDKSVISFCARDNKFKPGSGYFDLILDLPQKRDHTIKAKFDFLKRQPVKCIMTAKHVFGCVVTEGKDSVLIVELIEWKALEGKKLIAYVVDVTTDDPEEKRDRALESAVEVAGITADDEVVSI